MSENSFVVIDIETSNSNQSSICQIGLVEFSNGVIVDEWQSLINPQSHFDPLNVTIHGIQPEEVESAPALQDALPCILSFIGSKIVASYGQFDRYSLLKSLDNINQPFIANPWLDITRVVRQTWPERYALRGYSLANVCFDLDVSLTSHHNALCDARAAGKVLDVAIQKSDTTLIEWLNISNSMAYLPMAKEKIDIIVNPDGPLLGEVVTFTGPLGISRDKAMQLAADAGCTIKQSFTKKTTILVVGSSDYRVTHPSGLSSKHRNAIKAAQEGQKVKIIDETDFYNLIKCK
ncbi:exonuclease domain-containing protein [Alkalimonas sp. NCh-2]|uniref:exonuclease domain-containing protein n=1 Tax=Alkalimonas sp. NCh-2 TaxID=3144846 RepID=UPI0031F6C73F